MWSWWFKSETFRQFGSKKYCCTERHLRTRIHDLDLKASFLAITDPPDQHADVVLIAIDDPSDEDPTPVHAHKVILVSRSPVFKAMFENDMQESQIGTVNISGVSYGALCAFVDFLYTAKPCLDGKMAEDVLVLAERYQVTYLKTYCEEILVDDLDWEKAISTYAFARQYNADKLLDAALELIIDNINEFATHPEYEFNPEAVIEIYEAYLSRKIRN